MLEKPNIPDEQIISRLQEEYNLRVSQLSFLPLGADEGSAVYRVRTDDNLTYFLKLRKGFQEIVVAVPLFLKSQGLQEIICPLPTTSAQYWADFDEYKMILYPFVEGKDGFERELTDEHRRILGAALKKLHTLQVPQDLRKLLPTETFDARWRERLQSFQTLVETRTWNDTTAAKLADFMKSKQDEIFHLAARTEELAVQLRSQPPDLILCHTDIHGGNILISSDEELYIVDWDNPLLAPKERDLMFIGGGIDSLWKSEREEAIFYEGYGKAEIHFAALAYYRYERVIEDLAVIGEQIFASDEGGADRERSYGWFTSNFEPGSTIEIARKTDQRVQKGHA